MSTLKAINVAHPSSATNNIVTDASGNVSLGGTLTALGSSSAVAAIISDIAEVVTISATAAT